MTTRNYTLLLVVSLCICAYAVGLLVGHEAEQSWHGRDARSKKPALGGARMAAGAATNDGDAALGVAGPDLDPARTLQRVTEMLRAMDRAGKWNSRLAMDQVNPMLFFLSAKEYPELWKLLQELKSAGVREQLQSALLYHWSQKDPQGALAAVVQLPASVERDYAVDSALTAWAKQNPQAALARAREMPEGERRASALAFVLLGIAEKDPKAAARLLGEVPAGRQRDWAAARIFDELAPLDLEGAMALFKPRDETERENKFWTAAALRAERSLPDALAWAQDLADEQERGIALRAVIHQMAKIQPQQAIDFANSQSDPNQRKQLIRAATESWARKDVQAAFAWVSGLPEGPLREAAWDGMDNLAEPETAVNFTLTSVSSGTKRSLNLQNLARDWIAKAKPGEDQAPLQFAERLPAGPDRDAFLSGLCRGLGTDFPEQAARLAVTIDAENSQTRAVQEAVQHWATLDPVAAAGWSAALQPGAVRVQAFSEVANKWSKLEPAAAAKWLQTLPDDPARAAAAASCFSATLGQRTDLATQALALVSDVERRNKLIEEAARDWLGDDPESARVWLEQTSLPAERKERVLKQ